jgi:ribosomal protein S1
LIHISELAWQRIDNPTDLFKVGEKIKAEVISVENSKIFLSAKKLIKDPWAEVEKKYKIGQLVEGKVLKVNPFGLFVKLDDDIHGLAHISQLGLGPKDKITDKFKAEDKLKFEIVSMEPKDHRLGLGYSDEIAKQGEKVSETAAESKPIEEIIEKKPKEKKEAIGKKPKEPKEKTKKPVKKAKSEKPKK